ncbi:hypothetical protein FNF28_07029 [Cafeteria roenbergensis]|uniref:26S proteasome non-ATPase regulatory subunit 2 n=1 Tax=Cafeteria roenbergensis TaxID=33653 RepID=A0A5A8CI45_CAFRO|nr:hypothetical protein FNF28_07029 [Cafeteria roenbergensis]
MSSSGDAKEPKAAEDVAAKAAPAVDPEDGLTDEDRELKERLEEAVAKAAGADASVLASALETLRSSIQESTSSMTSVPKPLKFLAPHYEGLKRSYAALPETEALRPSFSDILSVLAMVSDAAPMAEALAKLSREENQGKERKAKDEAEAKAAEAEAKGADGAATGAAAAAKDAGAEAGAGAGADEDDADVKEGAAAEPRGLLAAAEASATRECLEFKLTGDPAADIGMWGHEYIRTLAGQVGRAYEALLESEAEEEEEEEEDEEAAEAAEAERDAKVDRLMALVHQISPYCMSHNAEAEAVDLLMETQQLSSLVEGRGIKMDASARSRVCLYLLRCADFLGDEEDQHEALHVALALYLQNEQFTDAARVALRIGHPGQVRRVLEACGDGEEGEARRLQIGYLLGRHGYRRIGYGAAEAEDDEDEGEDDDLAAAAATVVGSALTSGMRAVSAAGAAAAAAAAAPLHASFSARSTAEHMEALNRPGAVGGTWLPEPDALPVVARLSDEVKDAIGNAQLSMQYRALAKELDLTKPRAPEEVFKSHLADSTGFRPGARSDDGARLSSARANLASSYVSAFVNLGHGRDALLYEPPAEGSSSAAAEGEEDVFKWVHSNNADGRLAAAGALGLIHLWDHEEGPIAPQPLTESADPQIVAGGALAVGLSCVGTATEADIAKELLDAFVDPDAPRKTCPTVVRSASILSLALAYAGSGRADVRDMLAPYISDTRSSWGKDAAFELAAIAALGAGFVFVGTADRDTSDLLEARLTEACAANSQHPLFRQMALGLGLVFMGQGAAADATLHRLEAVAGPTGREIRLLLTACAYAGTGNVLRAQEMLRACGEHPEADFREKRRKELEADVADGATGPAADGEGADTASASAAGAGAGAGAGAAAASAAGAASSAGAAASSAAGASEGGNPRDYQYQTIAALGLGIISMGEELGATMVERAAEHLMQYGDPAVRRAVPLTLAMCRLSDPAYATIDTLSKLSHDAEPLTAQSAILAMGLVGAGTNNSRLAGMLRQLATFHRRDQDHVFLVRIAQGLVAAGKGLVTLSPLHSDRVLVRPVAVAAVLSTALCSLDLSGTLLGRHHSLLFCLAPAFLPRMVMTVDADTSEPVPVDVRIGTAVETVGQAGNPKTITGFQTHTTPALMNARDRAEVADEAWKPLCTVLEGVVLVKRQELADQGSAAAAQDDRVRAAAASALARVPSRMAGIMASAAGAGDD